MHPHTLLTHRHSTHQGRDKATGEEVAIKVIYKKRFERDEDAMTQFRDEIAIMQKLRHPNIIEYRAVGWVSSSSTVCGSLVFLFVDFAIGRLI